MAAIRIEGLTKRYGTTLAVDHLDLEVEAGQVFGFLGPNGAGKTTTIRMLVGLVVPTEGHAWVAGRSVDDPLSVTAVGSMIEEPAFYPWMSGAENLEVLRLTGPDRSGDVGAALERVGLAGVAGRPVRTYSQGMRQRLGLAAAVLRRPPLLILDEPTNGLDPAGIREIRGLLRELVDEGATVFLSSHLLAEVEHSCDRAAVIAAGRLVAEGPLATLGGARQRVRVVVDPADLDHAVALLGRWPTSVEDGTITVGHPSGRDVNAALLEGGVVADAIRPEQSVLEERFLQLVADGGAR